MEKKQFHEESLKLWDFWYCQDEKNAKPSPRMRAIVKLIFGEILPLKSECFGRCFQGYPSIQAAIKLKLIGIYNLLVL